MFGLDKFPKWSKGLTPDQLVELSVKTTAQFMLMFEVAIRFECALIEESKLHNEKSIALACPAASVAH
jgi:hypothetical protein